MVDMIYAAWPAFLYTNPAIGRYLLEPVLVYQAANPTSGGYAVHDIGKSIQTPRLELSLCPYTNQVIRIPASRDRRAVSPGSPGLAARYILTWSRTESYPVEGWGRTASVEV